MSRLPEGKAEYRVTLTRETVLKVKGLMKELGIPRNVFSMILDMSITQFVPTLEAIKRCREEGRTDITQAEFMAMVFRGLADVQESKQMKLFEEKYGEK